MTKNLQKIFSSLHANIAFLVALTSIGGAFYYFADFEFTQGNYGILYAWIELVLQWIVSFLFALFVSASVYKIRYFSQFDKKSNAFGIVGSFLAILVGGCPACSISFASYLGLSSFLVFLPYGGIELKLLGFIMLLVSIYYLVRDLENCRINQK